MDGGRAKMKTSAQKTTKWNGMEWNGMELVSGMEWKMELECGVVPDVS